MKRLLAFVALSPLVLVPLYFVYAADIKNTYSTNLVAHWEMEETSGTRADSVAAYDLTDGNTVLYGTGIQGNGADFEAATSETLQVVSDLGLNYDSSFTVSVWFKIESSLSSNDQRVLVMVQLQEAKDIQYALLLNSTGGTQQLRIYSTGPSESIAGYTFTPSLDTWYHAVMAITYNTSSTGLRLYLNGSSVATATSLAGQTGNTVASTFILGKYQDLNGGSNVQYWDGIMDEVTVWSRVLSAAEVSAIYNGGSGIVFEDTGGASWNYDGPRLMWVDF